MTTTGFTARAKAFLQRYVEAMAMADPSGYAFVALVEDERRPATAAVTPLRPVAAPAPGYPVVTEAA